MAANNDLTILVTLKGRDLFTLRWMWHANATKLPFHIILADGEVKKPYCDIFRNKKLFPNISYDYLEFDDRSYLDFYKKCADAARTSKTPYLRLCDNDDFVLTSGLLKDIEFLNSHPDYAMAQGGVAGMSLLTGGQKWPHLTGSLHRLAYRYNKSFISTDFSEPSMADRILRNVKKHHPLYYCVCRKEALQTVLDDIVTHNFSDLQIHEYFIAWRLLTFGKARSTPTHLSYVRQYYTSMHYRISFGYRLIFDHYITDLYKAVDGVAAVIAKGTNEIATTKKSILENFAVFLENWMIVNCRQRPKIMTSMIELAKNIIWLYQFPMMKTRFLTKIKRDGADRKTLQTHHLELVEIEQTLTSKDFARFIETHASESTKTSV